MSGCAETDRGHSPGGVYGGKRRFYILAGIVILCLSVAPDEVGEGRRVEKGCHGTRPSLVLDSGP